MLAQMGQDKIEMASDGGTMPPLSGGAWSIGVVREPGRKKAGRPKSGVPPAGQANKANVAELLPYVL